MQVSPATRLQVAIAVALLAVANIFVYRVVYPLREPLGKVALASGLPQDCGPWIGEHVQVDKRAYRILNADAIMQRAYTFRDRRLEWMFVVGRNRRSIHKPPSCYQVAGWLLSPEREVDLQIAGETVRWREVVAEMRGLRMVVWYTFTNGVNTTPNWLEQQLLMGAAQLRRERPLWAQLQLAAPTQGDSEEVTRRRMLDFLECAFEPTRGLLLSARIEQEAAPVVTPSEEREGPTGAIVVEGAEEQVLPEDPAESPVDR